MTPVLLILAAICFALDAARVPVPRVSLTPLGLTLLTIPLIVSAWPAEVDPD